MDRRHETGKKDLLLLAPLLLLLAARHYCSYRQGVAIQHMSWLLDAFRQVDSGDPWVASPALWSLGIRAGGPLYAWLHLPARLFQNPVFGLHLIYLVYEALGLAFWVLWSRRARLDRSLVWISGLMLCLYWDANAILVENMQIAAILAPPLFMTLVVALGRSSWRAMVFPGVLLSLSFQVHGACLVLLPAIGGCLLASSPQRTRRALGFLLGFCCAYLLALPGIVPVEAGEIDGAARMVTALTWADIVRGLASVPADPLPVAGLLLLLVSLWTRGWRALGQEERLSALWLVTLFPVLFLGVILSQNPVNENRLALLKPARAMLSALAMVWVARSLGSLFTRISGGGLTRWGRGGAWVGALTLAFICKAHLIPACMPAPERPGGQGCGCKFNRSSSLSYFQLPLVDGLIKAGLAAPGPGPTPTYHGPWQRHMGKLCGLARASLRRRPLPEDSVVPPRLAALPAAMAKSLGHLKGAILLQGGGWLVVPVASQHTRSPVTLSERTRFDLNAAPGRTPLTMAAARQEHCGDGELSLSLMQGGERLEPLQACACREEDPVFFGLYRVPVDSDPRLDMEGEGRPKCSIHAEMLFFGE